MNSKLAERGTSPHTWLRFLIIVLLVMGVFFRFVNLDRKIYWIDEVYTSLRISGYTATEVAQQLLNSQIIGIQDLHKYQRTNPEKSVVDTINGLAKEEPHLTPLYFVMARFWAQLLGNSVAITRSLSAVISLLAFPCIYWLCLELFESPQIGWLACALIAISPFQVIYAQEARQYSLWTVAILLSSSSLLRAIRVNSWRSWGTYAATVALGLYSHLFFVLVAIAHAIYLLATTNSQRWRIIKYYLITSLAGIVSFLPWLIVVLLNYKQALIMTKTQEIKPSIPSLVRSWLGNLSRNFLDTGFSANSPSSHSVITLITLTLGILLSALLVTYSFIFLYRNTKKEIWLFVLILSGFTSLAIIIPDLIFGRRTSLVSRYMIPCYLGVELAVAYFLASKINSTSGNRKNKFWKVSLLALLSSGVISCAFISQSETSWSKPTGIYNQQLSQIINQASSPLIIQEIKEIQPNSSVFKLISLSYLLKPIVKFKFVSLNTVPEIPQTFSTIFFIQPSSILKARIENQYKLKIEPISLSPEKNLWKLDKKLSNASKN